MKLKAKAERLIARLLTNWHQKVIALVASLFIFIFYRISTQSELPIPLEDPKRPSGYELSREWPPSIKLIFRGNQRADKFSKDDFKASVDLSGFTEGGTVIGKVKVDLQGEAAKGGAIDFEYSPSAIEFVLEPVAEKYVPIDVKGNVAGTLPPGYTLENLAFTPANVLVRGPKSLVERVAKAGVEGVDLTGKKSSFAGSLKILTGSKFVRAVDAAEVKVTVVIQGRKTIESVGFLWNALRSELSVREAPKGRIEIEGSEKLIEGLKPEDLSLVVDCRPVTGPGEYTLAVVPPELPVALAAEGKIVAWEPKEITLRFERKEGDQ